MTISYEIILTIINLHTNDTETFTKDFSYDLNGLTDVELYNNYHTISNNTSMFNLFKSEIQSYCDNNSIAINNIDIDEFNIISNTERVDIYFEPGDGDDPNQISLNPNIKAYVYPKYEALIAPILNGEAYDDTTIIWSWEDDGQSHYLVSEAIDITDEDNQDKIIAQIPIGDNIYTETGLEANTSYTRRLIAYNSEQTSSPSKATTVQTATAAIDQSLDQYQIEKNYDYTSDDSERNYIDDNLIAFHSGIGDYNDLKVYKQMDADFYQKFKSYIQLRGERTQKEKRYDSVGFNYKVCLESTETVEEQKGEVTFDIDVYPRENISIKDYMYATQPVTICARMWCDVLVKKSQDNTETVTCELKEPKWEKIERDVPNEQNTWHKPKLKYNPMDIVFIIDITKSSQHDSGYEVSGMYEALGNHSGVPYVVSKCKKLVDQIETSKGEGTVYYSVIEFDEQAFTLCENKNATECKNALDKVDYRAITTTNWSCALAAAKDVIKHNNAGVFFFSDGGANNFGNRSHICHACEEKQGDVKYETGNGVGTGDYSGEGSSKIVSDIQSKANSLHNAASHMFVTAAVYKVDEGLKSGKPTQTYGKTYMKKIADLVSFNNF